MIDVDFFGFTLKRTTADIVSLISTGSDFMTLLPQFIADYWSTVLFFILLVFLSDYLYKKTEPTTFPTKHNYFFQFSLFIIGFVLMVIASRGGLQLRPVNVIHANKHTKAQNVPLVLNTPFTFMKSLFKKGLTEHHYFDKKELHHIFNPKLPLTSPDTFNNKNVVVIIMESFSKEYIGWYNNNEGYTPFLDSLMDHSTVFTRAFANGKRSIEALPAIYSGIPNLMDNPYISSAYAGNKINSIASILNKKGYNSSFFHGGSNGTMGFDAFTSLASIQHYYGREEYNNEEEFDGNWGIFDEPFFQYFNERMKTFEEPFFSSLFSLSSHHPYTIPDQHTDKFPKGTLKIHESIGYADYALKKFFEAARTSSWFENTLFLITADHTAQGESPYYNNSVGMYAIPLILYDPQQDSLIVNEHITQQADISTILLQHLNYEGTILSYGKNPLEETPNSFSINYNNGIYQFIYEGYCLQFDGYEVIGLYNLDNDSLLQQNLVTSNPQRSQKMEWTLKAIIQSYNHGMIHNNMYNE